jgi:hypothetical protein
MKKLKKKLKKRECPHDEKLKVLPTNGKQRYNRR